MTLPTDLMDFDFGVDFDFGEFVDFNADSHDLVELESAFGIRQLFDHADAQNQTLNPSVPKTQTQTLSFAASTVPQAPKQSAKQLLKAKRITARESKRKQSISGAANGRSYVFRVPVTSEPVPRAYGKLGGTIKANVAPPPGLPIYAVDIIILAPRWIHRRMVMWNLIRNGWTQHDMAAATNYYRGLDLKDNDVCKHVTKAREVNDYQKGDFATMPLDEIQALLQPSLDWGTGNWGLPDNTATEIPAEDVTIYDLVKGVVNWPPDETPFWSPLMCCAQYCQQTGNQTCKLSDAANLANSIGFRRLPAGVNHDANFLQYIRETLPKRPRRQSSK